VSAYSRFHDANYVLARNRLIPQAAAAANAPMRGGQEQRTVDALTRIFSMTMDKLSADLLNGEPAESKEADPQPERPKERAGNLSKA